MRSPQTDQLQADAIISALGNVAKDPQGPALATATAMIMDALNAEFPRPASAHAPDTLGEPMTWRPIETAPLSTWDSHVRVLLWCPDRRGVGPPVGAVFGCVREYPDGERYAQADNMLGSWTFSHWMLVTAPEASAAEKQTQL